MTRKQRCENCGHVICGARSVGGFVCSRPYAHDGDHIDRSIGPDVVFDAYLVVAAESLVGGCPTGNGGVS